MEVLEDAIKQDCGRQLLNQSFLFQFEIYQNKENLCRNM
jgi:hypothetical protein